MVTKVIFVNKVFKWIRIKQFSVSSLQYSSTPNILGKGDVMEPSMLFEMREIVCRFYNCYHKSKKKNLSSKKLFGTFHNLNKSEIFVTYEIKYLIP